MTWMLAPMAACLVMAVALGWFGLHVLQREVIFVDLALAQVAALGTTYAVFLGHEPEEPVAYALGLVFTVVGAVAFAVARRFESRVPVEALIGIAYVVCAAMGAVLLDFASDPHGAEKLQHLMVGNVVWVRWTEVATMTAVVVGVGVLHLLARRPLLAVSFAPEEAERDGWSIPLWDLGFYLTFGVVITSIVHVAGVLLIFSYLIVPAVIARLLVVGVRARLFAAWGVSIPVSLIGVAVSYEHAAGPIIVALLGASLAVALLGVALKTSKQPLQLAGGLAGFAAVLAGVLWGFSRYEPEHEHHDEVAHAHDAALPMHDDLPADADPGARATWYRAHPQQTAVLTRALAREDDASLRLLVAVLLARSGEAAGLRELAALTKGDVPFLRMEAEGDLQAIAGDSAPADGAWAAWAEAPPADWTGRAARLPVP